MFASHMSGITAAVSTASDEDLPTSSGFDQALYKISDCLAESRYAREQGQDRRARVLYLAAERLALQAGFVELIGLVWSYEESSSNATMASDRGNFPFARGFSPRATG